jgi:hypothetical protein
MNERADVELIKAQLAAELLRLVAERSGYAEASARAAAHQVDLASLQSGDLERVSIEDLVALLNDLDLRVGVTVGPAGHADARSLLEKIATITASVPEEEWEKLPTDLAANHDHYLYGAPKRQ